MRYLGMKTRIMKEDLLYLVGAGLLDQADEPQAGIYEFKTTDKGQDALSQFYKLVTQFFTNN
jgi:hypothetical protein